MKKRDSFEWWHGVLFYAGVQLLSWGIRSAARRANAAHSRRADRAFYKKEKLPVFAPPGVAFPIAWSINSASAIAGGLRVLNRRRHSAMRVRFLRLQAAAWLLFAAFNAAYFELRSPINAAAITLGYSCLTAVSIKIALAMRDRGTVIALLPTAAWLALANPVAITVAAWNRDEFWKIGPLVDPPKWLLK
jgi:tryptophan-rich sensory protein